MTRARTDRTHARKHTENTSAHVVFVARGGRQRQKIKVGQGAVFSIGFCGQFNVVVCGPAAAASVASCTFVEHTVKSVGVVYLTICRLCSLDVFVWVCEKYVSVFVCVMKTMLRRISVV